MPPIEMSRVGNSRRAPSRGSFFGTRRFQLGGAILLSVIVPWVVWAVFSVGKDADLVHNTLIASALALVVGYYFLHSLTIYPGVQASYFILPALSASYALILLVLVFARIDYSRSLLGAGFGLSMLWLYGVALLPRRRLMRIGVVPFGDVQGIQDIKRVKAYSVPKPDPSLIGGCEALVADFHADLPDEWERFLADATLGGVTVLHVKQFRESLTGRVQIEHISENNFGSLIPDNSYLKIKHVFDFVTALCALVLLAPFLLLVAAAVRLETPGSALFRQRRVGYGGRPFTVYKFRTMRQGAASDEGCPREAAITEESDPRITRLGRLLRRSRIDELPQLINIVRGEMSWIGPRPEAEVLSRWYESELPFYRYRHIVRPGISGWAQVNQGHVADVDSVLGKLQYDFYYIRYFSPWLDALIVVRTLLTVITGFGWR